MSIDNALRIACNVFEKLTVLAKVNYKIVIV